MSFKELEGKIINCIYVNNNKDILKFETNHGVFAYATYGDCCNEVWFEHVSGSEAFGGEVLSVESKDWEDLGDCPNIGDNIVEAGFWTIKTTRGYIDIEVRNSHNGYYGGNIEHYVGGRLEKETFNVVDDF